MTIRKNMTGKDRQRNDEKIESPVYFILLRHFHSVIRRQGNFIAKS